MTPPHVFQASWLAMLCFRGAVPACAQAGVGCVGSWFNRGNCTNENVNQADQEVNVKTYCYAPSASHMGKKAASGAPGTCFIPRFYECDSDSQCRPGTRCVSSGNKFVCDLDEFPLKVLDLATVLKLVRARAQDLISALSDDKAEPGRFTDMSSGVLSPLLGATGIPVGQRVSFVQDLIASFEEGKYKDMGETSRSGATFVFSADRRFIAKTIRAEEFTSWAEDLLPRMGAHLALDAPCNNSAASCGWSARALSASTLNVPVLGFRRDDSHMLVLPAVDAQRRESSLSPPLGGSRLFDVKPLRAHSHERKAFVMWLADTQSFPGKESSPRAVRSQWSKLRAMLDRDMKLLEEAAIVDYSILAEVYEDPPQNVKEPGPQCVALAGCFGGASERRLKARQQIDAGTQCRVLCLNIIDYTLKYNSAWKAIESQVIRNKWDNYLGKSQHFANCIGNMGFGAPSSDSILVKHDKNGKKPDCQIYGDILCESFKVDDVRDCEHKFNTRHEFASFEHGDKCKTPSCRFSGPRAAVCAPFLAPACASAVQRKTTGHLAFHVITQVARGSNVRGFR